MKHELSPDELFWQGEGKNSRYESASRKQRGRRVAGVALATFLAAAVPAGTYYGVRRLLHEDAPRPEPTTQPVDETLRIREVNSRIEAEVDDLTTAFSLQGGADLRAPDPGHFEWRKGDRRISVELLNPVPTPMELTSASVRAVDVTVSRGGQITEHINLRRLPGGGWDGKRDGADVGAAQTFNTQDTMDMSTIPLVVENIDAFDRNIVAAFPPR